MTKQIELRTLLDALSAEISCERNAAYAEQRIFSFFDKLQQQIVESIRNNDALRKQVKFANDRLQDYVMMYDAARKAGVIFDMVRVEGSGDLVSAIAKLPQQPEPVSITHEPFNEIKARNGVPIELFDGVQWQECSFVGSHQFANGNVGVAVILDGAMSQTWAEHVRMKAQPAKTLQVFANVTNDQSHIGLCGAVYTSAEAAQKGATGYKPNEFAAVAVPVTVTVVGSQHANN